jgi:hypothetical protein
MKNLKLLTLKETAQLFELKINENGRCKTLERWGDSEYCEKRGIKPLPYYFEGIRMQFDPDDIIEFREQFKKV